MTTDLPRAPDGGAATRIHVPGDASWDQALANFDGTQLILAGPGTGKTQFLAERVARLAASGISPTDILVLTFSRRAAAELDRRIAAALDRPASGIGATTFHSHAHRLLERHHAKTGTEMPTLLTGPEQVHLISTLLNAEDPSAWPLPFRPILSSPTLAAEVADFVTRCRERLIDIATLEELAQQRSDWRALPAFLATYDKHLSSSGRIDYGTLTIDALAATEADAEFSYAYVVVDEYQDASPAQARLAESSVSNAHLTVGSDPNQSVYSFRGADLETVLSFSERMRDRTGSPATIVNLTQSRRVPAPILAAAERLVAPNVDSVPAGLAPKVDPAPHDGIVDVFTFDQRSAEAEWIASEVARLHFVDGQRLDSMAVLVRSTRYLLPELSRSLDRRGIIHDRPDRRLVDHPAIRIIADVVIAATAPPGSSAFELAIRRLLLGPLLSLPLGRERELVRTHRSRPVPWPELLTEEGLVGLAELIGSPDWAEHSPAAHGFWQAWDRLPGIERLVQDPTRADFRSAWTTFARLVERQSDRDASVSLLAVFEAAESGEFEASPLLRHTRSSEDRLVVTTLHQAKGLEFDTVFIADAIDGVLPDTRRGRSLLQPSHLAPAAAGSGRDDLDARLAEERRLAYTATTRARHRVVWTATTAGLDETQRRPSRFLLAVANAVSFDDISRPPSRDIDGFAPLSAADGEAQLRRLLANPHLEPSQRLAALAVLADDDHGWDPRQFPGVAERGPDTGLIGDSVRLSPSQAIAYDRCPRQYAIERRMHISDTGSVYTAFGSIIHDVLEAAEQEAIDAGLNVAGIDAALRHLEAIWPDRADFGTPALNSYWFGKGAEFLTVLYESWPGHLRRPVNLELELSLELGGVEWIGRADRIDAAEDGLVIVDYKTSASPPLKDEYEGSLQLAFYILAAAGHPSLAGLGSPVGAELWIPRADRRDKAFTFDMARLDEATNRLEHIAEQIKNERWDPVVGRQCERCKFKSTCPAWPDGRESYR